MAVRDISKKFRVYHRRAAGLKERILGVVTRRQVESYEELWAVRDVSLEVAAGETLGLIGPNGSGKSTLLQIVAGIYSPDRGDVRVRGRLRALLELGAGFNPELSGRENVLLNGQLLGFRKPEIKKRFNTIVDFAEIERFIDMPLKTYSSGMQMRLAFSIATHLDPEVLLLDEVLAVGDDHFQRKCLKRIYEIRDSGAAILFISHDLMTVERICDRVGLLMKGRLIDVGEPADMVGRYQSLLASEAAAPMPTPEPVVEASSTEPAPVEQLRWGSGDVRIQSVSLVDQLGNAKPFFRTGEAFEIRIEFTTTHRIVRPVFGISVRHQDGTLITGPNTKMSGYAISAVDGPGVIQYRVPHLPLLPGTYRVAAAAYDQTLVHAYDHWERCCEFLVLEGSTHEKFGVVTFDATWTSSQQTAIRQA